MSLSPSASIEVTLETPHGFCALSHTPLDVDGIIKYVQDDAAGAIALFIGKYRSSTHLDNVHESPQAPRVTHFKVRLVLLVELSGCLSSHRDYPGKAVTRLEYQAYSKLAIKTLADIMREAASEIERSEHQISTQAVPCLIRCAIHHRLGFVPVGEPSIVIAVSSPHRKESFISCESILEKVKRKAQIWKREYYEGEPDHEAEWKANQ